MFVTTILVNVGMWLERYMVVVPALERKSGLTFTYGDYAPSLSEFILVAASFALGDSRVPDVLELLPIMPAADIKEGQILADRIRVGRANVPAAMRE